jgi:hypothetical protein
VACQLELGVESFGAALAQIIALILVNALHVSAQQFRAVEGFGTVWARELFALSMTQFMLTHVRRSREFLAAVAALCDLDLAVRGLMGLQVRLLQKPLATYCAAKPPHA